MVCAGKPGDLNVGNIENIMKPQSAVLVIVSIAIAGCSRPGHRVSDKLELPSARNEVPSAVDPQFVPCQGIEYHIVGPAIFRTKDSGPAERDTSIAWTKANEFVYRTSLATEYALPASCIGSDGDRFVASFDHKKSKKRISILVNIQTRTVSLK